LSTARFGVRRSKVAIADLGLVPGQLGAEAEMDAPEERQRADVLSGDVEAIGLGVDLGIPVRGAE